jgi:uncharacterized PurR-regulated membrane protein YhhQ (DUF165 family)
VTRAIAITCYLLCIVGANWAIERYGFVSVGFGYMAPAGVWFAGFAFTARDVVHRQGGRVWVIAAIVIGAALSWFIAPSFAVASGVAFLVSETADMAVYTPLYRSRPYLSIALSNTVGSVVDSLLFLWLAFGSVAFWQGNVIGKLWTILPALALLWMWRRRVVPERVYQPGFAD